MLQKEIKKQRLKSVIASAMETKRYCLQSMINMHKNVVCYGLGGVFNDIFLERNLKEKCHVNYLSDADNNKWGMKYYEIICIEPEQIKKLDDVIVIICINNSDEAEQMFSSWGIPYINWREIILEISRDREVTEEEFKNNTILEAYDLLSDEKSKEVYVEVLTKRLAPQLSKKDWKEFSSNTNYFNQDVFRVDGHECFVDCGAYTGDSLSALLEAVETVDAAYCFEIAKENYNRLLQYTETLNHHNIHCYNVGVWSEKTVLSYGNESSSGGVSFSIFKKSNMEEVIADKLDVILENKRVTLIKMDIEGAEMDALLGAKKIIREQTPKLAICLYHRIDDFWKIPMFIKKIAPDYHIGVRQQSNSFFDTVLYAYC